MVQKSGAWFAYGDERLGQGRENSKQFLKENDEIRERILYDIYDKLGFNEPSTKSPRRSPKSPQARCFRARPLRRLVSTLRLAPSASPSGALSARFSSSGLGVSMPEVTGYSGAPG